MNSERPFGSSASFARPEEESKTSELVQLLSYIKKKGSKWNFDEDGEVVYNGRTSTLLDPTKFPYWPIDDPDGHIKALHDFLLGYDSPSYTLRDVYRELFRPLWDIVREGVNREQEENLPPIITYSISRFDPMADVSSVSRVTSNLRMMCHPYTWESFPKKKRESIVEECRHIHNILIFCSQPRKDLSVWRSCDIL